MVTPKTTIATMIVAFTHSPTVADTTPATRRIATSGFANGRASSESAVVRRVAAASFGPTSRRRARARSVVRPFTFYARGCRRGSSSRGHPANSPQLVLGHDFLFKLPQTKATALRTVQESVACIEDPFPATAFGTVQSQVRNRFISFHSSPSLARPYVRIRRLSDCHSVIANESRSPFFAIGTSIDFGASHCL